MGKNKHSKIMRFLNISCEAETHTIPKPRDDSEFSFSRTSIVWENTDNSNALPYSFRVNGNPCNHQCLGMCKFPYHGNILWKAISFPGCVIVRKLELTRNAVSY